MRKMTVVIAAMTLSLGGCQTCNSLTQRVTGHFKGAFGKLGNCSLGNCGFGGASNVGDPCDAGCEGGYGPASDGCQPCAENARYGSYGEVIGGQDGVVIGSYEGTPRGATMSTPSTMIPQSGTSSSIPSGSYLGSPSATGSRGESILPKLAN
jgi:hypothetical protein